MDLLLGGVCIRVHSHHSSLGCLNNLAVYLSICTTFYAYFITSEKVRWASDISEETRKKSIYLLSTPEDFGGDD